MKTLNVILLLSIILLGSCSFCRKIDSGYYSGLESMLDYYYYHYGDYPNSLEELEEYSTLGLYDSAFLDTLFTTTRHLKEDIETIEWLNDDCFPNSHLLILKGNDTLIYRINDNRFTSLDEIIELYTCSYGSLPPSPDALLTFMDAYIEATKYKQDWKHDSRRWEYDNLTVRNFQKCKDNGLLNWSTLDDGLLIIVKGDTIADWSSEETGNSLCNISPNDVWFFYPRFYDYNGNFIFCDNKSSEDFAVKIRDLRYGRGEGLPGGINGWHIIRFTSGKGLQALCPEDEVNLNTRWCLELGSLVKSFSEEHNIGEIIFITPIFE